jgi:PilZ domain
MDKRLTKRKFADYLVEFYDSEGLFLTGVGRLIDLSPTGALVESTCRLMPEQTLLIRLRRGENSDIDLSATVVRVLPKAATTTYGLKFIRD